MPTFLIERDIPDAGTLSTGELREIAAKSNEVLAAMAPRARWLQSYVTDDRLYCVYDAEDDGTIREHARRGGFPANRITSVVRVIDPTTAVPTTTPTVTASEPAAPLQRRARRRRLLGAAGALALVAASVTAGVVALSDDDGPERITTPPAGAFEQPDAFNRAVTNAVSGGTLSGPQIADGYSPSDAVTSADNLAWLP